MVQVQVQVPVQVKHDSLVKEGESPTGRQNNMPCKSNVRVRKYHFST